MCYSMYIIYLYNILIKNIYSNKNPSQHFDDCIYIILLIISLCRRHREPRQHTFLK
jgi:hypothetical protein